MAGKGFFICLFPLRVEGIREALPGQVFPPEVQKMTGWEPGALLTGKCPSLGPLRTLAQ